jgi:hypothetical protein
MRFRPQEGEKGKGEAEGEDYGQDEKEFEEEGDEDPDADADADEQKGPGRAASAKKGGASVVQAQIEQAVAAERERWEKIVAASNLAGDATSQQVAELPRGAARPESRAGCRAARGARRGRALSGSRRRSTR